jgi:hypothetical protein
MQDTGECYLSVWRVMLLPIGRLYYILRQSTGLVFVHDSFITYNDWHTFFYFYSCNSTHEKSAIASFCAFNSDAQWCRLVRPLKFRMERKQGKFSATQFIEFCL